MSRESSYRRRSSATSFYMFINGLLSIIICYILSTTISYLSSSDKVSCRVEHSTLPDFDGYYSGLGGVYVKRGVRTMFYPDFYDFQTYFRSYDANFVIIFQNSRWKILHKNANVGFISSETASVDHPPNGPWYKIGDGSPTTVRVVGCRGSLQNSPDAVSYAYGQESNIQRILHRPVNSLLLLIIFFIFYLCYNGTLSPASVVMSYESIVLRSGEEWRIVTSSLTHFDLMHLGFNTMTLYQIGDIEIIYGSSKYFYLSLDLIVVTIVIALLIQHVLITRLGREDMIEQQAVGYSCVLFAWMVVISVRMREFCPIFLSHPSVSRLTLSKCPFLKLLFRSISVLLSSSLSPKLSSHDRHS